MEKGGGCNGDLGARYPTWKCACFGLLCHVRAARGETPPVTIRGISEGSLCAGHPGEYRARSTSHTPHGTQRRSLR